MEVKCISIRNPYAYLICAGGKDIENRTWNVSYRGRLYIHASGEPMPIAIPADDYPKNLKDKGFEKHLEAVRKFHRMVIELYEMAGIDISSKELLSDPDLWFMKSQAIIGHVDLVDIIEKSKSPWAEPGQKHWILKNPVLLEKPVLYVKGKLSIWNFNLE